MSGPVEIITISPSDQARRIVLSKGQIFKLRMKAFPGTGYSWYMAGDEGDFLEQIGDTISESVEGQKLGGPEYQVFSFKAVGLGTKTLEFQYKRPWEKDSAPKDTCSIVIEIKAP